MNERATEWDVYDDDDEYDDEYIAQIRDESERKGETKGLQRAIISITDKKYPAFTDLAKQAAQVLDNPDSANFFLRQLLGMPDEESWLMLLNLMIKIGEQRKLGV